MTFFESDIKLSYISSSGVCVVDQGKTPLAPSNMIFFGASLKSPTPCFEDIIHISASSSSSVIIHFSFFIKIVCRQFFFFKHFNGFEFWFKFRSYFFRTGISLLGVCDFFPAILKRKNLIFRRYSFFETVWWHDLAIRR